IIDDINEDTGLKKDDIRNSACRLTEECVDVDAGYSRTVSRSPNGRTGLAHPRLGSYFRDFRLPGRYL
ncbi:hypothetical protein GWI33_011499, partial [Rhynchophorus ferrugineus]